jgi:hypothetical protein
LFSPTFLDENYFIKDMPENTDDVCEFPGLRTAKRGMPEAPTFPLHKDEE